MDELWGETPLFGAHFIRKLERRLFFTVEYGGKAVYAKVIGFVSRTAYGVKDDHIFFTVTAPDWITSPSLLAIPSLLFPVT